MDFKLSQIKTISFLTYLLRTFPQLVAPHLQQLSDALVQLMRTCPDIPAMRKELLVTARHTFGNNHRGSVALSFLCPVLYSSNLWGMCAPTAAVCCQVPCHMPCCVAGRLTM